jgi:hypothetical protein
VFQAAVLAERGKKEKLYKVTGTDLISVSSGQLCGVKINSFGSGSRSNFSKTSRSGSGYCFQNFLFIHDNDFKGLLKSFQHII